LRKPEQFEQLALVQGHQSMEGRPIVRESTLAEWKENPAAGNELHEEIEHHHTTLYPPREYKGHKWGNGCRFEYVYRLLCLRFGV
jgi:hypothetical protein